MPVLHRSCAATSALLLSLGIGCDDPEGPLALDPDAAALAPHTASGLNAPSNLTATAVSKSRIDLTWRDNSTRETGFEVHRSLSGAAGTFTLVATTGANVIAYSDDGRAPLTQYCYVVRAVRRTSESKRHSAYSNTSCAATLGPPAAPSIAVASPASSSAIDIGWSDNALTEDGFRVERATTTDGPWVSAAIAARNATSFTDRERPSDRQACYRIVAFNAHGESSPSNAACTTPPAAPTGLTATTATKGVEVVWSDNSTVEDDYEIQRSEDGVTFYVIGKLAANSASYHDASATNIATTYWYRVRAGKDGGWSDISNVATAQAGCTPTAPSEWCGNGVDDDCDGYENWQDSEGCACGTMDCFGNSCPPGYICDYGGCCVSHCNDGFKNATEGDVDCGGDCSTKCQVGQSCMLNGDCESGICYYGKCR